MTGRVLVVAKAPSPGRVKTRLGAVIGLAEAADLARRALLDTIETCVRAFPVGRCLIALDGDLTADPANAEVRTALAGWAVFPQRGRGLADRLVRAHRDAWARGAAPGSTRAGLVQIGMDTPQITPAHLLDLLAAAGPKHVALGPAADGGWWGIAHHDPASVAGLAAVTMSTSDTGRQTRATIEASGYAVTEGAVLRDVDTLDDARRVAEEAPGTRFAEGLRRLPSRSEGRSTPDPALERQG